MGGSIRVRPVSVFMVVATRKKMSNRKAMSAWDPALMSGVFLLSIAIAFTVSYYLNAPQISVTMAVRNAAIKAT